MTAGPAAPAAGDGGPRAATVDPARTRRKRQVLAALLLALAALCFWSASRLTWSHVAGEDGLGPQRDWSVRGADWSPWLLPLALALLAAIAAALVVRGWALRVLAALVAIGGIVAAIPAISLITNGADSMYAARAADIPERYRIILVTANGWVAAVVLAGTLLAVGGAIMLLRLARGAAPPSKYKTPAARRAELERQIFAEHERRTADPTQAAPGAAATAAPGAPAAAEPEVTERMMWDALDTGIDPTSGSDAEPGTR